MRNPLAAGATIFSIALYFALFLGLDAFGVLASPMYGLDEPWHSQIVYWVARVFGLTPLGLLKLAAAFGAVKLVAAAACLVHALDRFRRLDSGCPDPQILEGALLLVAFASIASMLPAIWAHDADVIGANAVNLGLAAVAAVLNAFEQSSAHAAAQSSAETTGGRLGALAEESSLVAAKPRTAWYSPWH